MCLQHKSFEITVEKEEIPRYEHILLFPVFCPGTQFFYTNAKFVKVPYHMGCGVNVKEYVR